MNKKFVSDILFKTLLPLALVVGITLFLNSSSNKLNFVSVDATGKYVQLEGTKGKFDLRNHQGEVVILYFGYRNCPDVCPTTLSLLSKMYKGLEKKYQDQVQIVFISVDVERDTIDRIADYVSHFHKDFIGATGTKEQVRLIANYYGVMYEKYYPKGKTSGYYSVDHSIQAHIIGPDGEFKDHIEHEEDPRVTKTKILKYIRSK